MEGDLGLLIRTRRIAEVAAFLEEESADPNQPDLDGLTPLCLAVIFGELEILNLLLEHPKIQVNLAIPGSQATPFFIACQNGNTEIFHRLYSDPRVHKTRPDGQGCTPFFIACQNGHLAIVKQLLLDPRVDVNQETSQGCTPFFAACSHAQLAVVRRLMKDIRVDINKGDSEGRTPLYIACSHEATPVVKQLLTDRRLDVNREEDTVGFTPLIIACGQGNLDVVRMLVSDPRIDLKKIMKRGLSPLDYSAHVGNVSIVKWILASMDPRGEDVGRESRVALRIAQDFNHREVAELIRRYKADPLGTRVALREELKCESKPSDILALLVLLSDGHLRLKEHDRYDESLRPVKRAFQFFDLMQHLPFDVQMLVCNRAARSSQSVVSSAALELSFKEMLFHYLHRPSHPFPHG